ncbi:MAG: 3-alpha-hydroxysteroid dehydrogenase [Acidimicrobiales bacterium]|nr:3-alpha-hydroxysteroid dehydrogenase [Acidimicrobiales bacterium]
MAGRLDGKVAIITGAARGQGEQEARLVAAEGARVMLTDVLDVELKALADDIGDAARAMHHDVAEEDDWAAVVAATQDAFGRLDVLVNNAGIHHVVPIDEETVAGFQRIVAVNLLGTFLGVRSVIDAMRAGGGGAIVNISSLAGVRAFAGHAAYSASKYGVRGVTQVAAIELGPFGIRVNSVHPGMIDTAMLPPGSRAQLAERVLGVPLRRVGTTDDVASLVLFLASDESSYLSGAEITIDGGAGAGRPMSARP